MLFCSIAMQNIQILYGGGVQSCLLLLVFDGTLYRQIDGVAMSSSLGPTVSDAFLVYDGKNW